MREFPFAIGAAVCSGVVTYSLSAIAGPVTDADLRGKTICWNTGVTVTYGQDGFFYSSQVGNGTWRLVGDRVITDGVRGEYTWTITKQGGTLHNRWTEANTVKEAWGKYCN